MYKKGFVFCDIIKSYALENFFFIRNKKINGKIFFSKNYLREKYVFF